MASVTVWVGRILGALLAALCLFFLIGEGDAFKLTRWHLSLDVALVGLILGLFKPLPCGIVALAGIAAFYVFNYLESGRWPGGWVFPLFWVAGAAMVVGAVLSRQKA